jgi:hypothetical protein
VVSVAFATEAVVVDQAVIGFILPAVPAPKVKLAVSLPAVAGLVPSATTYPIFTSIKN